MIETELNAYLLATSAITDLVGTRIYPVVAPVLATEPYLVYFKVSSLRVYTHDGYAGLQRPRMQISCYASRYLTVGADIGVKSIAEVVKTTMEAWQGSAKIQASFVDGETDLWDSATKLFHIPVDVIITYGE